MDAVMFPRSYKECGRLQRKGSTKVDEMTVQIDGLGPNHECYWVWTRVHKQLRAFKGFEQNDMMLIAMLNIICRSLEMIVM